MPMAYFETMAKASGHNVSVTAITNGGHTLGKYADPTDSYGKLVAEALSVPGLYDYVIIQEQSTRPISAPEKIYNGVRALAEKIQNTGAQPVLYATWGRKTGSDTLTELNMTNETMTLALATAYDTIGNELQIPVCHVGESLSGNQQYHIHQPLQF